MDFSSMMIRNDEKAVFTLRALYHQHGYSQFKMRKFEEYDLYVKNKDFLISDSVITFTDTNGKLMALKPDVTLSIIKNTKDRPGVQKLYYDENVYRVSNRTHAFTEILQMGLECIGEIDSDCITEVLSLAAESLKTVSENYLLDISSMDIVTGLLDAAGADSDARGKILRCIGEKNGHELKKICASCGLDSAAAERICSLLRLKGRPAEVLPEIRRILGPTVSPESIDELERVSLALDQGSFRDSINIDFSVINDMNYYNGIVFKGFISGVPTGVLSGGQYDKLMKKMGRSSSAIGFAVYLDMLERIDSASESPGEKQMLNIALPKGRLGEKVYAMFAEAGYECPSILENSRKLIFENPEKGVRYFWVKPSDVAIYVERGAADIGVAGKDILREYEPDIYELLDLGTGNCVMAVAAPKDFIDDPQRTLRVATKFENIARNYYSSLGRDIDIIHLNGSIEIAPIIGLSDVIVDIVETGTTLKENNLCVKETIVPISARLIANRSGFKFNREKIEEIVARISSQIEKKTKEAGKK